MSPLRPFPIFPPCPKPSFYTDVALGVTLPARHARGRMVRLGPALDEILATHDYPPLIEQLLAEALALTALLGAMLKEPGGQLTLQAQTEGGIVDLLVCDYQGGELRGYVRFDRRAARRAPAQPALVRSVRQGLSRHHLRPAGGRRALPGHRAARGREPGEAAQSYFAQSEQIPSLVRLAAEKRDGRWVAGGLLLQHLPEGEEGRERLHTRLDHPEWPHVAILGGSVKAEELTDPELPLDDLSGACSTRRTRCGRSPPCRSPAAAAATPIMCAR